MYVADANPPVTSTLFARKPSAGRGTKHELKHWQVRAEFRHLYAIEHGLMCVYECEV